MLDVFETCPEHESENFILRLVEPTDAGDLLDCYSDTQAVRFMNADRCTSDFHFKTIEEMRQCIGFWLREYANRAYVRFAIVGKATNRAVGTVEMFGGPGGEMAEWGMLRIDIASAYEKTRLLREIICIAIDRFYEEFRVRNIVTKAIPEAAERREALEQCGFTGLAEGVVRFDRPRDNYFVRPGTGTHAV